MNEEEARIISRLAATLSNLMSVLEVKGIITNKQFHEICEAASYMGDFESKDLLNRLTGKDDIER